MEAVLMTIGLGLAAGSVHVVAGPDHLAAVAPFAAKEPNRAAPVGFWWGVGHGLGAAVLGGIGMLARDLVNLEAISAWTEFLVGFMLIAVGAWAWRSALRTTVHAHAHQHDGDQAAAAHEHVHIHHGDSRHDPALPVSDDTRDQHDLHHHSHAPLAVGMLHGAAGTGHVLAVVPALALPPASAACYLSSYFLAAVISMSAFGCVVGLVGRRGNQRQLRGLMLLTATAAIIIGGVWIGTTAPI